MGRTTNLDQMSLNTQPEKWGLWVCYLMRIALLIQACKPKDPDPQILVDTGELEEGGMIKQEGTDLWNEPNLMATNETGFTALPGGFRDADGLFRAIESFTAFWSSSANEEGAWLRGLHYDRGEILHEPSPLKYEFSVRCVKDR